MSQLTVVTIHRWSIYSGLQDRFYCRVYYTHVSHSCYFHAINSMYYPVHSSISSKRPHYHKSLSTWNRANLNWIPPRQTNGDIQHYIIKYTTQDGTEQELDTTDNTNYYNLTGLERGQTYNNIAVVVVNSAGIGGGSGAIASYIHGTMESTVTTTGTAFRFCFKFTPNCNSASIHSNEIFVNWNEMSVK